MFRDGIIVMFFILVDVHSTFPSVSNALDLLHTPEASVNIGHVAQFSDYDLRNTPEANINIGDVAQSSNSDLLRTPEANVNVGDVAQSSNSDLLRTPEANVNVGDVAQSSNSDLLRTPEANVNVGDVAQSSDSDLMHTSETSVSVGDAAQSSESADLPYTPEVIINVGDVAQASDFYSLNTPEAGIGYVAQSMDANLLHTPTASVNVGDVAQSWDRITMHPDIGSTTPEMIARRGYPAETYFITTADNYIIQMHRIPNPGKPVVFLQHGLLGSSSDWIILGPELGLAYIMFDSGYDVWLGNARGNTYSRNHTFLDPDKDSEFWSFSWHHMAVYDLPAAIDHMLDTTRQEQIIYIGHSMGNTMFWILCSEKPKYNLKMKQMHALAPVAFMGKVRSPLRILAPFVMQIEWLLEFIGVNEFLPSSNFYTLMGQTICAEQATSQVVCSNIVFLIAGYDSEQMNETALPVLMDHVPAGSSFQTLYHYAQEMNSWNFEMYDFGYFDNKDIYDSHSPPDYKLDKITVPVYLHWSDNDWLAHPDDVAKLNKKLRNVKASIRVSLSAFNHLDFLWAIDVRTLLYDTILALVKNPLP